MEIFEYINNVLFFKTQYNKKENINDNKQYNIFMVNRWLSMYDSESANFINETTNKKNYLGNDREMHYKMLLNVLPKKDYRNINYIKKIEKEN
jgi:hypothetical protein